MFDLRRIRLVAMREWTTRLRQRSFQITTIAQIVVIVLLACVPAIVTRFEGSDEASRVVVIDNTDAAVRDRLETVLGASASADESGAPAAIAIESGTLTMDDAQGQVDDGAIDAVLFVERDSAGELIFTFVSDADAGDQITQQIYAGASAIATQDRLARGGIDPAAFESAIAPPAFTLTTDSGSAEDDAVGGTEYAIALAFTVLIFMAIILYGTWIAQGVVEEKSSRIMEIMINAATPRDLLAGKVIGIGLAALTQLLPMLLAGGIAFSLQRPIARAIGGDADALPNLDFGTVTIRALGFFAIYFVLGFGLYAAVYAGLGSLVSRQEEVNQAIAPMMTFVMIGYFGALTSLSAPNSMVAQVISIFPLTAPLAMLPRVIVTDPPTWQIVVSIGGLAISVVLAAAFAARLYRVGVLLYGQKPSLRAVVTSGTIRTAR